MSLTLSVLGANAALPFENRFSSSFVLAHGSRQFLIDAGEGCQIKMAQFQPKADQPLAGKVKRSKITDVFISHLHGDHVYGLPGFITSLNLTDRGKPLTIWGPEGIKRFLETIMELSHVHLNFPLKINELHQDIYQKVVEYRGIAIFAFPLKHRIKNYGYLFREKSDERNIRSEQIRKYQMSIEEIKKVKSGCDLKRSSEIIRNDELTYVKEQPRSFAYCSDTAYDEDLVPILKGIDLLYHEATYTKDLQEKAHDRMHSTAEQAGRIAANAQVKRLLIGHYSSRYDSLEPLLKEAQSIFPNTEIAREGMVIHI